MTPTNAPRRGVTLIELLVVMAILTGLLALALMIVPNINNTNNTAKGAGEIQSACRTAQGMAASARLPRGVRFIIDTTTNANNATSTELQYLETPPIIISDPRALVSTAPTPASGQATAFGARVEFVYTLGNIPAPNSITGRQCFIRGIPVEQATQIVNGSTLSVPALNGVWSRVSRSTAFPNGSAPIAPAAPLVATGSTTAGTPPMTYATYTSPQTNLPVTDIEVLLEVYPDAYMGTATMARSYHFGVYGVPVPLLAEPTIPLPKGIVADLQISYPALPPAGSPQRTATDFDIMFSPDGPAIGTTYVAPNSSVYIWVRDNTKITNLTGGGPQTSMFWGGVNNNDFNNNYPAFVDAFRRGGEQLLVGIRSGGYVGTAPVLPADASGYTPFLLAQQQLNK